MGYSSENSIRSLNVPAKTKTKIQSEKTKVLLKMQTRRKKKKGHGWRDVSFNGGEKPIRPESALILSEQAARKAQEGGWISNF